VRSDFRDPEISDITNKTGAIGDLEDSIRMSLPDMEVHVMHENIFNSMHRI